MALAALLGAPAVWAKPPGEARMRLVYARTPAAQACADEAGMRDAVAARLGYDAFREHDSRAVGRVSIALDKRAGDWQARIELDDGAGNKGVRALSSREPTCDELVSSVSLAVALAIDPQRVTAPPPDGSREPPPAASAAPEPSRAPEPPRDTPAPPPASPPPEGSRAAIFGAVGGFVHAGVVPSVSLGPRLRAGVVWPKVSIAVEGLYVAPASDTSSVGRVQASIFGGGVVPCLRVPAAAAAPDGVGFDVCARALFGALFGETNSAKISTPSTVPWAAVGLELGLELPLGAVVRLRAHGGVLAAMTRTFLRIKDQGTEVDVYRSPVFSGGGGIDAVVLFP